MFNFILIFGTVINLNMVHNYIQLPSGCAIEYKNFKQGVPIYGKTCDEVKAEINKRR